ncbi:hypothetical protein CONLIGDRAFT_685921 [Coniochaeta ligniaria NRRL 30616]|uniref:Uncharacterized protein n=1 Tax=Coniochaeta ligniaria NRRL 30616 TaxID=1408157 RepID=A0A1J7I9H1_9PEZI|nr:hypothetical protein CONLIGDRAFT_685921 [Coniochaeta ligniaria NRRL 30616]
MTSRREIKPGNDRPSFASFGLPARQQRAYSYNPYNSPFETDPYYTCFKLSDVGQLNPGFPELQDLRRNSDIKTLVFTDVMAFEERLASFTSDSNRYQELDPQSVRYLISASVLISWNGDLTAQDRRGLRNGGGLPVVIVALRQQLSLDSAKVTMVTATIKFTEENLHLSDVAGFDGNPDHNQVSTFEQTKPWQTGPLDEANDAWQAVVTPIYSFMGPRDPVISSTSELSERRLTGAILDHMAPMETDIPMEAGTAMDDRIAMMGETSWRQRL